MANSTSPEIDIQISVSAGDWQPAEELHDLVQNCVKASNQWLIAKENLVFPEGELELSLLFTDNAEIKNINGEWRDKNTPTNVLSFPSKQLTLGETPLPILGDIIFAFETVTQESTELEKPFEAHLSHLIVHGYLHLLGFDHVDSEDAEHMELTETRILASLGLSNPYNDA